MLPPASRTGVGTPVAIGVVPKTRIPLINAVLSTEWDSVTRWRLVGNDRIPFSDGRVRRDGAWTVRLAAQSALSTAWPVRAAGVSDLMGEEVCRALN